MTKTALLPKVDPELDPLLEQEFYPEPSALKERLDIEENQGGSLSADEPQ